MNRIYKVIWSKVKHQYVVVSEFAHSCTKSTGSRVGGSAAAVLTALVLTMGVGSVQADEIGGVTLENNSVTATTVNSYSTVTQGSTVTNHLQAQTAEIKDLTIRNESGMTDVATLDSNGNFNTVGKVAGASGEFGGFTFADGVMKDADGNELSVEDIKNAAEAWNKATDAQGTADAALDKATDAQGTADAALNTANENRDRIGWDEESGDYKEITVADQNGTKFNNLTDALNYTKGIVGDGKLTNGGSTLTEGININSAAIAQNRQDINNLNHRVDKVGAGAAALAALHPLDFDPDAKWDFAAGYGNYNGENAVAVGTFYRPNEDTMFSVGGTFGNGENMINAGVSFKIGAGSSHVTTSRTAMAKEIKSMRDIVAKQDAQIQKLTAMVNALVGVQTETDTTTMFPDVPENHWAYEAVAAMAKSGLVKGYPDGEFKGDRNMTRYEFAQIVHNAIQAGANVDARLVEEFKPELEFFHVATVAKDKDGNPTIERVRAN